MQQRRTCQKPEKVPEILSLQNEERLRQLIKNSFDMIVLIGADGIQQYVSESCINILGFKPEELINIPVIEEMVHPDDQDRTMQGLYDIIGKKGSGGAQYRHRHKNGNWVYLEAYGTNQLDNPAVNAIVLNVRDVSERKQVEQALQENELRLKELNAGKDKFFSIIAHDLKSPFNSILGLTEMLLEQVQERDYNDIESYAMGIRHSAKSTLNLLTNLLDWSLAHTGRLKYKPCTFDMVELIIKVHRSMEDTARQKAIILYYELPPRLLVYADKDMMASVLRNLISNGIKFTHQGGGVKINAFRNNEGVKVMVSDNGVGISEEVRDKLFKIEDSFSTQGTFKEQGTGLGLLLCREFIDRHGCRIGVESEVGKGSTFWFTVPEEPVTHNLHHRK